MNKLRIFRTHAASLPKKLLLIWLVSTQSAITMRRTCSYGWFMNGCVTSSHLQYSTCNRLRLSSIGIMCTRESTPSHEEKRELMYQMCQEVKWWDWQAAAFGR